MTPINRVCVRILSEGREVSFMDAELKQEYLDYASIMVQRKDKDEIIIRYYTDDRQERKEIMENEWAYE